LAQGARPCARSQRGQAVRACRKMAPTPRMAPGSHVRAPSLFITQACPRRTASAPSPSPFTRTARRSPLAGPDPDVRAARRGRVLGACHAEVWRQVGGLHRHLRRTRAHRLQRLARGEHRAFHRGESWDLRPRALPDSRRLDRERAGACARRAVLARGGDEPVLREGNQNNGTTGAARLR